MSKNKLKIGSLELESNVVLAPMAGLTDTVYRKLIRKYSSTCLLTTEMLSSESIVHNPKGNILKFEQEELPLSFQISGHKPDIMARAAKFVNQFATTIDIIIPVKSAKSPAKSAYLIFLIPTAPK